MNIERLRNIGVIAHIDAGKTTTTERLLYFTGKISRTGEVHDGATTMDWMIQEKERGITITSAATQCEWKDHTINIIDTPGHVDFTMEVERCLRVLDGAVLVLDGGEGVQPQTLTVNRQSDKYKVPRVAFVNKLDKVGADFMLSAKSIVERLGKSIVIIQIPVGTEKDFCGVIDLVRMKKVTFTGKQGSTVEEEEIPKSLMEKAKEQRKILLETLVSLDEKILERFLENEEADFSEQEIKGLIKKGTLDGTFIPVLCGSSYKNVGVQNLLDAIIDYLPSPIEKDPIKGEWKDLPVIRKPSDQEPFSALIFKIVKKPYNLNFVRIYSGTLTPGTKVFNPRLNKDIRIGRIVKMHANKQIEISETITTGDIIALLGDYEFATGDTICSESEPLLLEKMYIPPPVIEQFIVPNSKDDSEKLAYALTAMRKEDPSFGYRSEEGQIVIYGMGDLHLNVKLDILSRDMGIKVTPGQPSVKYLETPISGLPEVTHLHKKQTGGAGQFAGITFRIVPGERGKGFIFVNKIVGAAIPNEYVPAVEEGFKDALQLGPLSKSPVTDIVITLLDGRTHPVDSSNLAFRLAAREAMRDCYQNLKMQILEPIMKVEVRITDNLGTVVGDLNSKRAKIIEIREIGRTDKEIEANVPLREMFGYINKLREITQGKGSYVMEFFGYEPVPESVKESIQKEKGIKS